MSKARDTNGCVSLWCAVIGCALTDATTKRCHRVERERARRWLTDSSGWIKRDRHEVCTRAGINPDCFDTAIRTRGVDAVADSYKRAIENEQSRSKNKNHSRSGCSDSV